MSGSGFEKPVLITIMQEKKKFKKYAKKSEKMLDGLEKLW